jgi:hypothetical protein
MTLVRPHTDDDWVAMPEDLNAEIAHHLHEQADEGEHDEAKKRHERRLEIMEAILLAVVAIATAWSGYQAAKWDGENARQYGLASKLRTEATQSWTLGGQQKIFDSAQFSAWLEAETAGKTHLANLYARRFSPEYSVAFNAWLRAGGLTNPKAPPGPSFMPEYHNSGYAQAAKLNTEAGAAFAEGTEARHHGDDFVRVTVLFATVLFLIAVGQRFKLHGPRVGLSAVSLVLLVFALFLVVTYPAAP